jgi:hypothetical protein
MPGLNGNQPAEPTAEHEHWPESQRTTRRKENDAKPTNSVPVEDPEPLPIRVGRKIGEQQPNQREGRDDPAVGTILAFAWAQISATEERYGQTARRLRSQGRFGLGWRRRPQTRPSQGSPSRDRQGSLPMVKKANLGVGNDGLPSIISL